MKKPKIEFSRGIAGKVVEKIVVTERDGETDVEIRFRDRTSMHFGLAAKITLEPELWDWQGERRIKRYPACQK